MAGRRCLLLLLLVCWIAPACPLAATEDPTPATSPTPLPPPIGAPVTFAEETLFSLYDQLGPFTTQERAQAITERLSRLAKDSFTGIHPVQSADRELTSEVVHGETVIMTVTEGDAAPTGLSRQELATAYALKIQTALTPPAPSMDLRSLLFSILWTLLATILLIVIWNYLKRLFPRIYSKLESWRNIHIRTLRVQNVDVLSADAMTNGLIWAAGGIRVAALGLLLYFFISAVFSFFPKTKGLAITLLGYLMAPLQATGQFHEAVVAIFFGILFTILVTVLLIIAARVLQQIYLRIIAALKFWRGTRIRSLKIQRVEILSADHMVEGLLAATRGIRMIVIVLALYFYGSSVLGFFPWTRGVSALLFGYVLSSVVAVATALAGFIPNLISIVVIVVVTRYIIKLIHLVFAGIERGAVTFSGFQREWARPTYKIIRFLVTVFAVIAAFPYIPGSQSEGFRGISVFLGVLLSFGSAGAISNIIAGVVLTYMNPFQPGDRVKIADTFGDITEKTLLVTRVRTIKNMEITIPNALVLSSHIINYSSSAKTAPALILHTKVTIGYDAPWRKVHEILIAAARATTHILETPEPFVLQTSLDDFYVTYEINAYTDQPNKMANIYAELHQNIQDQFNEAGVEIMSPHYSQIRDGNQTTIPEEYLPKTYQAPAFRIGPLGNLFAGSSTPENAKGESKP